MKQNQVGSYMKRKLNRNLSGNEISYANSLILLVKNVLCSKVHCQQRFNFILFSYNIEGDLSGRDGELVPPPLLEEARVVGLVPQVLRLQEVLHHLFKGPASKV